MIRNSSSTAAFTVALLTAVTGTAWAQAATRGEMLYSTHCIGCHTTEIHWRDKKVATDRASLRFQVRRWQGATGLGWSEADIDDVTRYLNESIYRYPPSADPTTGSVPPAGGSPSKELAAHGGTTSASRRDSAP